MAKIIPKLNLNKTPQQVENNSLIYAKNIKLLKDNSLGPEGSIQTAATLSGSNIVGHIVGNNKVYLLPSTGGTIYVYDEQTNTLSSISTDWTWHNGKITGCVTTNNTGEIILTICESEANTLVPIKHINLSHAKPGDESLYTQCPNIPIVNMNLAGTYPKTIPNGVYQFFVRFKIRENYYTGWFPSSKECFAGNHTETKTIQGKLKYTNIHTDANSSFKFNVSMINKDAYGKYYKSFQVGFIISHDDSSVARTWKEFPIDTTEIYFDYESVEEYDIDEILKVNYELFDIKNVDFFRNKLYISNYKESDFNPNISKGSATVTLNTTAKSKGTYSFSGYSLSKGSSDNYYTHYGSNSFATLSQSTDLLNSITEIVTESTSKITTNDGGAAKAYCGFDDGIDPDVYWIYKVESSTNLFSIIGKGNKTLNYDLSEGPFGKVLQFVEKGEHTETSYVKPITGAHPFDYKNVIWYDGRRASNEAAHKREKGYGSNVRSLLDQGLEDSETSNYINNFVKSLQQNLYNDTYYLITKVKAIYGSKEIDIVTASNSDILSSNNYNCISCKTTVNEVYNYLDDVTRSLIKGISVNNPENYWIETTGYSGPVSAFVIEYTKLTIKVSSSSDTIYFDTTKINCSKTKIISPNVDYLKNSYSNEQYNTLMPFTKYEFFVHYVKSNGIITNGISLGQQILTSYPDESDNSFHLIYPSFSNIPNVSGYVGWFISCVKVENEVCKCFDYSFKDNRHYISCIEEDTLLSKLNEDISIKLNDGRTVTNKAKYYSSGSTEPLNMFGGNGCISWLVSEGAFIQNDFTSELNNGKTAWIINETKSNSTKLQQLVKITPVIPITTSSYSTYSDMNLPGYAGIVYKLNNDVSTGIYVSGSDTYTKTVTNNTINIDQNTNFIAVTSSPINYIQSNYNINYLALTEEINPRIRTIKTDTGSFKNVVISVNSLTASDIYELPSMYRDYPRKYFSPKEDNTLTEFNNTIRSSDVNTDEIYRNIFKFESTDYYNIPCNKGIIINMFSIANNIYVHTQHSLYKFSGNTSLSAKDGEVTTKETDAFDTGISEIFDADNGFGGLLKKSHALVTYNAYVFYDAAAKIIYAYGGEGQMTSISRSIDKIIQLGVTDVVFAEDYYNDRFFVNIKNGNNNINLSYNFASKSFVSLHDFDFAEGFSSRSNTYFLYNNKSKLYKLLNTGIVNYGDLHKSSYLNYEGYTNGDSCIDIIYNEEYEKIKSLNYINWICSAINNFITNNFMAEENITKYSGNKLIIYTDQCNTEVMNLLDASGNVKDATTASIEDVNSYQYPRYNCGIWSLNYFRDIRNANNLFKYGSEADDKSLLYGKYFVIRFIFNGKNFKFENIHFNVNDYDKVQY